MHEVARTDDSPETLLRAHDKQTFEYNPLLHALQMALKLPFP